MTRPSKETEGKQRKRGRLRGKGRGRARGLSVKRGMDDGGKGLGERRSWWSLRRKRRGRCRAEGSLSLLLLLPEFCDNTSSQLGPTFLSSSYTQLCSSMRLVALTSGTANLMHFSGSKFQNLR